MGSAQLGEEQLMRALYAEHAAPLLSFVQRLLGGDRAAAEDVVQETLLRAWRHGGDLELTRIRPWLFTTARNLVVDLRRARAARVAEAQELDADRAPIADGVDAALDAALVLEALRSLSPAHRAVLIDHFYRGRTTAEIAAERGMAPGTARSRVHYAMRAMRLALLDQGVTGP